MVELYFKDKKLGTLNYDGNIYTYDSNIENENYAKNNYFLNLTDYNLYGSNLKISQNLFNFFNFSLSIFFSTSLNLIVIPPIKIDYYFIKRHVIRAKFILYFRCYHYNV